jgi:hypothetical protein
MTELGGDPACWLHLVCDACGAVLDDGVSHDCPAAVDEAHRLAVEAGAPGYIDPASGLFVLTSAYLLARGECCEQGCRHCPYRAG